MVSAPQRAGLAAAAGLRVAPGVQGSVTRARLHRPRKNSTRRRFCNKGTASAGPQAAPIHGWALAPAGRSAGRFKSTDKNQGLLLELSNVTPAKPGVFPSPPDAARSLQTAARQRQRSRKLQAGWNPSQQIASRLLPHGLGVAVLSGSEAIR